MTSATPVLALEERIAANLTKSVEEILAEHPVLSFDRALAERTCREEQLPFRITYLAPEPRLRQYIRSFPNQEQMLKFLARYVEYYEDAKQAELRSHDAHWVDLSGLV